MEPQTQDASQNRFSWKRPSGLEHHLLREVASVCRLPREKCLHLTSLGDPSVVLQYLPRSLHADREVLRPTAALSCSSRAEEKVGGDIQLGTQV